MTGRQAWGLSRLCVVLDEVLEALDIDQFEGAAAAGDQLAVIGHDFASLEPGVVAYAQATEILVGLRRALP